MAKRNGSFHQPQLDYFSSSQQTGSPFSLYNKDVSESSTGVSKGKVIYWITFFEIYNSRTVFPFSRSRTIRNKRLSCVVEAPNGVQYTKNLRVIIFHRIITTKQKPTGTHLSLSRCLLARYPPFSVDTFKVKKSSFDRKSMSADGEGLNPCPFRG